MAVLGSGGVLEISREIPNAMALTPARLNVGSISLANQSYWSGDRVILAAEDGVPFDVNGDGYADCPDGHGFYRGSIWAPGIVLAFYTGDLTDGSDFYHALINAEFLVTQSGDNIVTQQDEDTLITNEEIEEEFSKYNNENNTGLTKQFDGFINRDLLDRIKFWTTEAAGHSGSGTEKPLLRVKPGNFIITKYDDDPAYVQAINSAPGNFIITKYDDDPAYVQAINSAVAAIKPLTLLDSEVTLKSAISLPAGFDVLCDDANRDWKLQCDLEEWILSIDSSKLDVTAIGETFGENIKSLVRGAGSLQFLAENQDVSNKEPSLSTLRLVLLTQNQCNTKCRFYVYKDRVANSCRLGGSVYYECDILLTNTRLNTRATDIISGTADFVATSEIKLKVAT
jgi:hypothetical protein